MVSSNVCSGCRGRPEEAENEEQFQAIGLLCRLVLISVAEAVNGIARHPTLDGVAASKTDAKWMLDAIIQLELRGSVKDEARAHSRAAMSLVLAFQHNRTADFWMAALCAEGTLAVTYLLAILGGRRGRPVA